MAGRRSHLHADSVEEGMEQYLATCGASGLESVQRVARSYKAMPKDKRLARYQDEFEAAASWGVEDREPMNEVEQLQAELASIQARIANIQGGGNNVARAAVAEPAAASFVKGTSFTYRNGGGNVSEHTITRIAGNQAFTDTNKRFKVSTLEMLMENGVVSIV